MKKVKQTRRFLKQAAALAEGQTAESQLHPAGTLPGLEYALLECVPLTHYGKIQFFTVVVPPGKTILQHSHPEWIALYYVEPAGSPVESEGLLYLPNVGDIVIIPPGILHSVPQNETETTRISVALKVALPE